MAGIRLLDYRPNADQAATGILTSLHPELMAKAYQAQLLLANYLPGSEPYIQPFQLWTLPA
jgi:hypothetical protein